MTDFFSSLIEQSRGHFSSVRPLILPIFAPAYLPGQPDLPAWPYLSMRSADIVPDLESVQLILPPMPPENYAVPPDLVPEHLRQAPLPPSILHWMFLPQVQPEGEEFVQDVDSIEEPVRDTTEGDVSDFTREPEEKGVSLLEDRAVSSPAALHEMASSVPGTHLSGRRDQAGLPYRDTLASYTLDPQQPQEPSAREVVGYLPPSQQEKASHKPAADNVAHLHTSEQASQQENASHKSAALQEPQGRPSGRERPPQLQVSFPADGPASSLHSLPPDESEAHSLPPADEQESGFLFNRPGVRRDEARSESQGGGRHTEDANVAGHLRREESLRGESQNGPVAPRPPHRRTQAIQQSWSMHRQNEPVAPRPPHRFPLHEEDIQPPQRMPLQEAGDVPRSQELSIDQQSGVPQSMQEELLREEDSHHTVPSPREWHDSPAPSPGIVPTRSSRISPAIPGGNRAATVGQQPRGDVAASSVSANRRANVGGRLQSEEPPHKGGDVPRTHLGARSERRDAQREGSGVPGREKDAQREQEDRRSGGRGVPSKGRDVRSERRGTWSSAKEVIMPLVEMHDMQPTPQIDAISPPSATSRRQTGLRIESSRHEKKTASPSIASEQPPPIIHVRIGRVEVRGAVAAPAQPARPAQIPRPGMTLNEYLQRRGRDLR